ncbi:MAG TPA: S8 family serine peptidase, partial [Candidatus Binatia bacterium]|nr:S8 family serine peptidase [Candidatus Binatia bacterium]
MPRPLWIRRLRRAVAWMLTLSLLSLSVLTPTPARAGDMESDDHVPDELLVGFHDDVDPGRAEAVYQAEGGSRIERLWRLNVHRIRVNPAALRGMEQRLRNRPEVAFVEPNRRVPFAFVPDDPEFSSQWHHTTIRSSEAWSVTLGAPAIVIAILDSGVDGTHPDLAAKLVSGWNFYNNDSNTADVHGHGTRVAGAAAAIGNNGIGVAGVALESRIMPIRVSDSTGYAYYSTIASGLTWAVDNGARVMNLSFGGVAGSSTIRNAAKYVRTRGGVVVAAAGNCGCVDATPENIELISVSGTTSADTIASWSSRGNYVDVSAPGASIRTTNRGGTYGTYSGTSFSSPITAGVVALMMAANPSLSPIEIEQLLKANADDLGSAGWDPSYGFGRVNAYRAVAAAAGSAAPDTAAPTVSISSPASGATVSGTVTVSAAASDNVGVTKVEFLVDGALVGTRTATPWSVGWNTTTKANGSRILTARAFDAAGNSTTSAGVSVTVNNVVADTTAPTVSISSPASGATVSGTVTVSVAASDNVGVTKIEIRVDGALVATRIPWVVPGDIIWSFRWNTTTKANGSRILTARAFDAAGNSKTSAGVSVTVNNVVADTTAPTVSISSPASGATVSGTVTVSAAASDNVGVTRVEFLVDG